MEISTKQIVRIQHSRSEHKRTIQCYQASELEGSFRDYDGVFMFRVPDWFPHLHSLGNFLMRVSNNSKHYWNRTTIIQCYRASHQNTRRS